LNYLEERLLLFYTGLQRSAHEILKEQVNRTKTGETHKNLEELSQLVQRGCDIIVHGQNLNEFGELLHYGWEIKKSLSSSISNNFIDEAYTVARKAGAIGGKLLGAGGGGFLLLYAEPYNSNKVRRSLPHLKEVPFAFEAGGSSMIYYKSL